MNTHELLFLFLHEFLTYSKSDDESSSRDLRSMKWNNTYIEDFTCVGHFTMSHYLVAWYFSTYVCPDDTTLFLLGNHDHSFAFEIHQLVHTHFPYSGHWEHDYSSKVVGHKIDIWKSAGFLYTNHKLAEKGFRKNTSHLPQPQKISINEYNEGSERLP